MAGLAWAPFWYGSNDLIAWGINAVLFPGLAALYEIQLLIRGKHHPIGLGALGLPAVLFAAVLAWIEIQTLTWAPSPLVNPIWGMTASALGRAVPASISVNRDLTTLALVRLITAASVFWTALQLCRDGMRASRLIAAIATIGTVYAAYGIVAAKAGPLPWLVYLPSDSDMVSATFINHNSFATYAGLGVIAISGLILRLYQHEAGVASGGLRLQVASFIEATGGRGAALLAGGFLILVALILTGSRGGVLSTGLGLFVLGVLARRRGQNRVKEPLGTILFGVVLVAATLLAFGGLLAGSLEERGLYDAGRMAVYLLTLRSILYVPLLGYGYGTFADVFPMYRDRSISVDGIWAQAHDTYLEVFQGLGVVFGSMLVATIVLLVLRCIKGAIRRQQNVMVPRVAASAACLVGVHALVDFSLQMQAVALTMMAMLGAGVAQSESSRVALDD